MAIILWNKIYTETLAETLDRFRDEQPEYQDEKVTYAGRLDPMAEGLLILLTGDDVHKKDEYLGLDKIYEVDFIFGPETDTYDILGLVETDSKKILTIDESKLIAQINENIGEFDQKYPVYSSKPVDGKPLFMWAREGRLNEIIIPTKKCEIFTIELLENKNIPLDTFRDELISNISQVIGDFRQDEIIQTWKSYFSEIIEGKDITIYSLRIHASSGTYMRSLIHRLGKQMNIPACTVKIKRVNIGNHQL